jgi:protein ImuB
VVEALLTAPLERRQRVLFADTTRPDPYQLAQLLDRLSSRLGSGNVVRASLQTEAQPELAYCYLPLTGVGARRFPAARRSTRRSTANAETSAATSARPAQHVRRSLIRPLHLRSPPLPMQVLALAPDGPPVQLFFGQRTFRVVRAWRPERLETGWWRGRSLRRDYYRLETACGHWLWVFHRLQDGRWFLHGMFG